MKLRRGICWGFFGGRKDCNLKLYSVNNAIYSKISNFFLNELKISVILKRQKYQLTSFMPLLISFWTSSIENPPRLSLSECDDTKADEKSYKLHLKKKLRFIYKLQWNSEYDVTFKRKYSCKNCIYSISEKTFLKNFTLVFVFVFV